MKNFSFILLEDGIEIPFFQRAYVWKEQFFNDLKESFDNKKSIFWICYTQTTKPHR